MFNKAYIGLYIYSLFPIGLIIALSILETRDLTINLNNLNHHEINSNQLIFIPPSKRGGLTRYKYNNSTGEFLLHNKYLSQNQCDNLIKLLKSEPRITITTHANDIVGINGIFSPNQFKSQSETSNSILLFFFVFIIFISILFGVYIQKNIKKNISLGRN